MAIRTVGGVGAWVFDAVFRPSRFVRTRDRIYGETGTRQLYQFGRLALVYLVNLSLYAIPLTATGIGVPETTTTPEVVATLATGVGLDPDRLGRYVVGFVQNSAYITVATVITLVTYHVSVLVTSNSRGVVHSVYTVTYSTSAYLAGLFTVVWYLSTTGGVAAARTFVRNLQRAAVYFFIDLLDADVGLPGGRPDSIAAGQFSWAGAALLAVVVLLVAYFLYSLYLGARLNHRMERPSAMVVVVAVCLSPAVYILGSIVVSTSLGAVPV